MPLGFLRTLFGRRKEEETPDLRGPLDLSPGDEVFFYQRTFGVHGVILLTQSGECVWQYHLRDQNGDGAVLTAEAPGELVLTLQEKVTEAASVVFEEGRATLDGRILTRTNQGTGEAVAIGEIPPRKTGKVESVEFEDPEEMYLLVVETREGVVEVRSGQYVHEGEITFRRQGDDRFEARPPPKIDLLSFTEAKRAQEAVERKVSRLELVAQDYRDLADLAASGAPVESGGSDPEPDEDDQPSMS